MPYYLGIKQRASPHSLQQVINGNCGRDWSSGPRFLRVPQAVEPVWLCRSCRFASACGNSCKDNYCSNNMERNHIPVQRGFEVCICDFA